MTTASTSYAPTARTAPLVVASVPGSHVYVEHLAAEGTGSVVRLPDPDPGDPGRAATQQWWPPAMLRPAWVDDHEFDLFHLHFGFDAWDPEELALVVEALRRRGRPLVFTVHDLRNPHHLDRALHDRQLDVLVPAADALITLTDGAAAEIRRRWHREALVVPHPHVVDFATMTQQPSRPSRSSGSEFRVGLHVKSLRSGMDPLLILPALVDAVRQVPGGVLQVNGHRDVLEPTGRRYHQPLADFLGKAAGRGDVDLRVHDYFTDGELWDYLSSLDASVLPYRFGTHSGWLEACRDLGTTVIAPTCGYYADQGPVAGYRLDEDDYDPESLVDAVTEAHRRPGLGAVTVAERREQRAEIAATHEALYRELLR